MSWIKDNQFNVALGGGTLLVAIGLYFVGSRGASKYEDFQAKFTEASGEASGFERLPLYPKAANRDGKSKAIDEYRKSVETLQGAFEPFRPKEIKNFSPQEFTNNLKATDSEIRKAFEASGTAVPEAFFVGFERYKTALAQPNATGILGYQLTSIRDLLGALSKAGATRLINLHRPTLVEEDGGSYTPEADAVARPLPLEITFAGPEEAVRKFLSSVAKPDNHYVVVRTLRISSEKKDPPRAGDAKFEKAADAKAPGAADDFSAFVIPGDTSAPAEAAASSTPAAPAATSGRILAQVLGNEEVLVFLRLDVMQFLPAKKLP